MYCYYLALCKLKENNEFSPGKTFKTDVTRAAIILNERINTDDNSKSEDLTLNKPNPLYDDPKIIEDGSDHEELKLPFLQAIQSP